MVFPSVVIPSVVLPSVAADEYRTYTNARFGTTVQYPANLLTPRPESQNGDGRRFVSKDELVELSIYASYNIAKRTAKSEMERAVADWKSDGGRLTYYKWEAGWYSVSGYIGDDIFYEKAILRGGVFHTLIWQYPKAFKARLDGPVTRTVRTFAAAKGLETPSSPPRRTPQAKVKAKPISKPRRPAPSVRPAASATSGY
jgi:hypothetical protein